MVFAHINYLLYSRVVIINNNNENTYDWDDQIIIRNVYLPLPSISSSAYKFPLLMIAVIFGSVNAINDRTVLYEEPD